MGVAKAVHRFKLLHGTFEVLKRNAHQKAANKNLRTQQFWAVQKVLRLRAAFAAWQQAVACDRQRVSH